MHPKLVDLFALLVGLEEVFSGDLHPVLDRQGHDDGLGSQRPRKKLDYNRKDHSEENIKGQRVVLSCTSLRSTFSR